MVMSSLILSKLYCYIKFDSINLFFTGMVQCDHSGWMFSSISQFIVSTLCLLFRIFILTAFEVLSSVASELFIQESEMFYSSGCIWDHMFESLLH